MTQPRDFEDPKSQWKDCKVMKSIYGLEQASQGWNLYEALKKFGFLRNDEEPCVYKKLSRCGITFLLFYIDDILLVGNNIHMLELVKE